jgi:hypothetical protein
MSFAKVLIIVALLLVVYQLAYAAYCLINPHKKRVRMVRALTWRITLSLMLFGFLLFSAWVGWLHPHSVIPVQGVR